MTLPTLYKKTSTGAIQFWTIESRPVVRKHGDGSFEALPGLIVTTYGQVGTESPQVTEDVIKAGKNVGRKNETSATEQAQTEAKAKWEKQLKKGYVESIDAAQAGEVDALIEGGIVPMLAQSFAKHGHKIVFPCYAQPKLDGIRCIAILRDGKCNLWSRTRKLITGVPHISSAIEKAFNEDVILDGELYRHEFKSQFEKIVSFVRQEVPAPGHEVVQYHVYDLPSEEPFSKRATKLRYVKSSWFPNNEVVKVETMSVADDSQAAELFEMWQAQGYEGAMLRNSDGLYVNKRSMDLQKMKEFDDAEFEIIGAEEGRGKLAGHIGAFICRDSEGRQFLAKMAGDTARLGDYFRNSESYMGKLLTVQYQGLTGANGVPRFPVGLRIRDEI